MNKKILFALPIIGLTVACAPAPQKQCKTIAIPVCTAGPANPTINVNTHSAGNSVSPPNACVKAGATVSFNVTPTPSSTTSVATVPKNPAHDWMNAGNTSGSPGSFSFTPIVATVPDPAQCRECTGHCAGLRLPRRNGQGLLRRSENSCQSLTTDRDSKTGI